ncbi:EAL domain-containing response regulator [Thalassotalea psychrophila]|uniref:EAL domain-containing response regulator n=1 Tax=Thalassotalea psychrophila TaxID=3065647 RepID=A0ABY9TRC3_9GAMM|nr:EAL domain-containing response regulator [Colwelliaceae bacterium SQ149]
MKHCNILIIEDDVFQRNLLHRHLAKLTECKIQLSSDGAEALCLLKDSDHEVVFCDLNLPSIDGVELVRYIAQKKTTASLVLMSSEASEIICSVKTMSENYGFKNVQILEKPMNLTSISAVLNDIKNDLRISDNHSNRQFVFSENELKAAFADEQLVAYFQPQINAESRRVVSAEALVRWHHPEYGLLAPQVFLEQIIKNNLSSKLTYLITEFAIKECKKWHDKGHLISISINVMPSDLMILSFPDHIFKLLENNKLAPHYLTLEVTESEVTNDLAKYLDTLSRLRLKGVNTAIDDFGTGNSSLMQLITSPFSELKIDKSFIHKMFEDKKHMIAVKASISLAKELKLKVVAEGIEENRHAELLRGLGCDILQGYLFSPPLPNNQFCQFIKNQPRQFNSEKRVN